MRRFRLPLLGFVLLGCTTPRGAAPGPGQVAGGAAGHECPCKRASRQGRKPDERSPAPAVLPEHDHRKAAVPVSDGDPSWGSPEAPVTVVVWSDFECPFCSRVAETLDELKQAYGPARLRLVWKNYPLAFHPNARSAAEAAMTVFALGGGAAFWKFHDLAFANQRQLSMERFALWAAKAGVDRGRFEQAMAARQGKTKIDEDLGVAARLSLGGTPTFHINGVALVGAQPAERFRAVIDVELGSAKELLAAGTPARGIYPALCARNLAVAAPPAPPSTPEDTKVWSVPVGKDDPAHGPADALVTLVLWSDFECPFCRRMQPTLAALMQKYGSDLRVVWKDFPLPFHRQAVPAAVLARLLAARKGPQGFWQAHDALMDAGAVLDEPALERIAASVGLPWAEVKQAIADRRFQAIFDRGLELAEKLQVRGTPCSFVNGRRLDGALPADVFAAVIESELDKARDLLETGQERAGLYAAITDTAEVVEEFERRSVDGPTKDNPSRGGAKAKVTMQMWGDFQCPNSQRLVPILAEVEKKFSGRLRMVWRHRPLAFHEDAALAAEAAQEVFVQKGGAAFWRYHDLLFAAQSEGGLERANLEVLARRLGVDLKRFRAALDAHRHGRIIERDIEAAKKAEIVDVPTVLVNGYMVGGVEPGRTYERLVERALDEASR
jgi:protein-disulfide isomerase